LPPIDMATTLVLPETPEVAYFTQGAILGAGVSLEESEDGSALLKGLKIFRTGVLSDSMGRKREWTHDDLDAAVENFSILRDELPNVPLRVGHNRNPDSVIGYYSAIRREGDYLVGDFEVTEPEAVRKIKRKTYRSRSMEIGAFESDQHGTCWPVAMGLAFVDIPAVSRLYENPVTGREFHVITPGDHSMSNQPNPDLYAAYYAQGLADAQTQFAANPPAPPEFSCFGAKTTDPAAVQAHIEALETFQKQSVEAARKSFVDKLVAENKILAPQKEHFESLALGMSSEQFELFQKGYEGAASLPLVSQFDATGGGDAYGASSAGGANGAGNAVLDRISVIQATHQFHRDGGMKEDAIRNLQTYAELQQLLGQSK
jgi:hypothetical protein